MLSALPLALILPGLNLRVDRLSDIAGELRAAGLESVSISLDPKSPKDWMPALRGVVEQRLRSQPTTHFVLVGHSLGANLGLNLAREYEDRGVSIFDGAFFLAPALQLQPYTRWVKALFLFGDSFSLSSRNHPDYRAERQTTMAAYRELFDSQKKATHSPPTFLTLGKPCRIVLSKSDELVSFKRTDQFTRDHHWSCLLQPIDNRQSPLRPRRSHLIVDQQSLGLQAWREVQNALRQWVGEIKSLDRPI